MPDTFRIILIDIICSKEEYSSAKVITVMLVFQKPDLTPKTKPDSPALLNEYSNRITIS